MTRTNINAAMLWGMAATITLSLIIALGVTTYCRECIEATSA